MKTPNFGTKMSPKTSFLNAKIYESRYIIGQNQIINRMYMLNGKIKYDRLNQTYDVYKIKSKAILLN